jgi:hypothetical protein
VGEALAQARAEPAGLAAERLAQMEEMMTTMNRVGERVLDDEDRAQDMLSFLVGMEDER